MDIEARVKQIIVDKLGVEESALKPETDFAKDLNADSLDTVELIMELEKEFDIEIEDEVATELKTVGDAMKFIKEKVGSKK